jgi:hypothetical protein
LNCGYERTRCRPEDGDVIPHLNTSGLQRGANGAGIVVHFVPTDSNVVGPIDEHHAPANPIGGLLEVGDDRQRAHNHPFSQKERSGPERSSLGRGGQLA